MHNSRTDTKRFDSQLTRLLSHKVVRLLWAIASGNVMCSLEQERTVALATRAKKKVNKTNAKAKDIYLQLEP